MQLLGIDVSGKKHKKYVAHVKDKYGLIKAVHFGDSRYEHYEDKTRIKIYKYLNHYDDVRRKAYKARHEATRHRKWSPSWFSDKYLW